MKHALEIAEHARLFAEMDLVMEQKLAVRARLIVANALLNAETELAILAKKPARPALKTAVSAHHHAETELVIQIKKIAIHAR